MSRLKVGVLFGGCSGEHEVSIMSAASVYKNLDPQRYDPMAIGISKKGHWFLIKDPRRVFDGGAIDADENIPVTLLGQPVEKPFVSLEGIPQDQPDVIFPVLHGPYGEDGTIQGLLDLAGIPYVGAGVLASSVGMDKEMMKKVFRQAGLPVVNDVTVMRYSVENDIGAVIDNIVNGIGYPCFVKPANLGSSVGISKAENSKELKKALLEASMFDSKLVVEEGVDAREIECSVLGNNFPKASLPGEIIPSADFYDYNAKYISGDSRLIIPASLTEGQRKEIQDLAIKVFKAIDCSGLGRVDFFILKDSGEIYVNEINTMPGFTKISMYPKLWEETGLPYGELLTKLVELAFERNADRKRNRISHQ
ncbi:MAG: D-alanine--D-alanine ligase [Clostridia bacterium]|nr:D-alanine--D-alanine ligase [Clostridia bacterium]